MHYEVATNHPIALGSLDHIHPLGTKQDNHTSAAFIMNLEAIFGRFNLLDLGCAGGALVRDCILQEHGAVGIEGSDWSIKHERPHWPELHNKALFTADIAQPFTVYTPNRGTAVFDVVTAWDVLEHIKCGDLPQVFQNVKEHLDEDGLFIGSIYCGPSKHEGVDLHETQLSVEEWQALFAIHGFKDDVPCLIQNWVREAHWNFCAGKVFSI